MTSLMPLDRLLALKQKTNSICLQSDGGIQEKNQTVVAERLASYFTDSAARIGGKLVTDSERPQQSQ